MPKGEQRSIPQLLKKAGTLYGLYSQGTVWECGWAIDSNNAQEFCLLCERPGQSQ